MSHGAPPKVEPSPLATSSPRVHGPAARAGSAAATTGVEQPAGWRRAGVLLHVTSLPGPDGVGDLGAPAHAFVDWLSRAGQRMWQTLPLHPPCGAAMDPYVCASAFAGNPLLMSLDGLAARGLLPDTLDAMRRAVGAPGAGAPAGSVIGLDVQGPERGDLLERVARWKLPLVRQAARQLLSLPSGHELSDAYLSFCEREAWWLADHVAFTALREAYPGVPRDRWPVEDRARQLGARRARTLDIGATHQHPEAAVQFLFDLQLRDLYEHATARDVQLVTSVAAFPGDDSADVWAHPELFLLDDELTSRTRPGLPPDARDPRGQVWAMAAHDWTAQRTSGYEWWVRRLRHELRAAHALHLDQFRTAADWWSVPARAAFAEQGRWEPGPGAELVDALRANLGDTLLVLDDSGESTDRLVALRASTDLPVSRVLVRGLDEGGASADLPTSWTGNEVAYTSSAVSDTLRGWAASAEADAEGHEDGRLAFALRFCGASEPDELPAAAIEAVMRSSARCAIAPLQDWLGLGSEARMHVPGAPTSSWRWVAPPGAFTDALADEMAATARRVARTGGD